MAARRGAFGITNANQMPPLRNWNNAGNATNAAPSGVLVGPRRTAQPPAKLLTMNTRGQKVNAQTAVNAKKTAFQVKESERLKDVIKKYPNAPGARNMVKHLAVQNRQGGACTSTPVAVGQAISFNDFIAKQAKVDATYCLPRLGRGMNGGVVPLRGPQTAVASDPIMERALSKIRALGGIAKMDPNGLPSSIKKRPANDEAGPSRILKDPIDHRSVAGPSLKRKKFSNDEIRALIGKKSSHENELAKEDAEREEGYFNSMEQKEKVETFVTTTMEVKDVLVISCRKCGYTSQKQSSLCMMQGHAVVRHKADKRFFCCRLCKKRVACFSKLPTKPCQNCEANDWERVGMRMERKVKDPKGELQIRGEERPFVNN